MSTKRNAIIILIALVIAGVAAPAVMAQVTEAPKPEVPQIYTITGEFMRIAYNNEGWVTLGYRTANSSQGPSGCCSRQG